MDLFINNLHSFQKENYFKWVFMGEGMDEPQLGHCYRSKVVSNPRNSTSLNFWFGPSPQKSNDIV